MGSSSAFVKDPAEVLDYEWDWSTYLEDAETISTSVVVAAAGITKDSDTKTTTTVTAWLSGGTTGEEYTVTNTITTSLLRTAERSIHIRVLDR